MSEATELLEKMEHAGHGGHGGHGDEHKKGPGKAIGVTMAVLGVMLALCAALVGSERTELIKTTVEQSNKFSVYQSETTKFRVIEADVEMLHALTPSKPEVAKFEKRLAEVRKKTGNGDDEDTAELKESIHVSTLELADVLTPDKEDEDRLNGLGSKYKKDMLEAKEDAESYDLAIEAHHSAAEGFERAQLCAEIGIVIASIALLMASRKVWIVSLAIGAIGAGTIAYTWTTSGKMLAAAEKKIEDAKNNEVKIETDDDNDQKPDEKPPAPAGSEKPVEK